MSEAAQHNYWVASTSACEPRAPLAEHIEADVAIVGAGFTGLWCAYHLKRLRSDWSVVVLEAATVGHGASGRNGGWVIGNLAGLARLIGDVPRHEREAAIAQLADNVDEIGRVLAAENIDADFHKGGILNAAARYSEQVAIQKRHLETLLALGHSPDDCYWLDARALAGRARFTRGYGAVFFAQAGSVHPFKLVRGLARACERAGVVLFEHSPATRLAEHRVSAEAGSVKARMIIQATEGYGGKLGKMNRHVLPVQSLVIATAPLSAGTWQRIGLGDRPAFCDASRVINYGQRSRDGRLIFGARGSYLFGGQNQSHHAITPAAIGMRRRLLMSMFPALAKGVDIDYGWGGSLGLSRSFRPHAIVDRSNGLATAGGYAGEGVAASHLMARTLAELITGEDTPRTRAPWAHADGRIADLLRCWEPEPIRWLAARTIGFSYSREEAMMQQGRRGRFARKVARVNDYLATIVE